LKPFAITAVAVSLLVTGCSDSECDPSADACAIEHEFSTYSLGAGEEIDGVCMSWTLGNETELWVNTVATVNDGYFHHSNWFFVPDNRWELDDGAWNCSDHEFSELAAAIWGGVLYAQSTQTTSESQQFLPGAAVRIPPYSRIIANTHMLNTSDVPVQTGMRVTLDTLPADQVTKPLTPFRLDYTDLQIAPMGRSEFGGDCDIATAYERVIGEPFRMKLHYVLPHYHALGDSFRLSLYGGERDGETLFEIEDAYGEPLGETFAEPFDVAAVGAIGLSFQCGFYNPTSAQVGWGIGDQEMCVMLGFAETALGFDGRVDTSDDVAAGNDGVMRGTGRCSVAGTPWFDSL
jgi:hypothetical protein